MNTVRLFTIAYLPEHRSRLEPGFECLDNIANERPDWREYWAMRRFLLNEPMDEATWYGFFSPRFREKTGLSAADVRARVDQAPAGTDLVTISPQPDIAALFVNTFAGGEAVDPGFLDTFHQCARLAGIEIDLSTRVMSLSQTVFSNYFVARPAFWRRWVAIAERIFRAAEDEPQSPLARALDHVTGYGKDARRKVFILEGVASLLIAADATVRVHAVNPFTLAWSAHFASHRDTVIDCAALKAALQVEDRPEYRRRFEYLRRQVLASLGTSSAQDPGSAAMARAQGDPVVFAQLPPQAARIVSVGEGPDPLGAIYRAQHPGCQWIDIALGPLTGSRSTVDRPAADAWILGESLTQTEDPDGLLRQVAAALAPGGRVVACLPNAQHWSAHVALSTGQTARNPFTRRSILERFARNGYTVTQMIARSLPPGDEGTALAAIRALAQAGGADPDQAEQDAQALSYVVVAQLR
jgi:hypothetical protein